MFYYFVRNSLTLSTNWESTLLWCIILELPVFRLFSVKLHLLKVAEHPKWNICVTVTTNFVMDTNTWFLSVHWWWVAQAWIIFTTNSAFLKSSILFRYFDVSKSLFKYRFKHFVCLYDCLSEFHTEFGAVTKKLRAD